MGLDWGVVKVGMVGVDLEGMAMVEQARVAGGVGVVEEMGAEGTCRLHQYSDTQLGRYSCIQWYSWTASSLWCTRTAQSACSCTMQEDTSPGSQDLCCKAGL